ncbi:MAG: ABC transporter permease [Candidatus Zixiibacteriota bacterium]|nr:MAG: ABC transporter permease [candidate division Zixibacteria bacterium]
MLKNCIKLAFRRIWGNKIHSLISVFGLAIGLACSLLILLYVLGEVGYDTSYKNSERIYRIISDKKFAEWVEPQTPFPLAPVVKTEITGIDAVSRSFRVYNAVVKLGEEFTPEQYFISADQEIFEVFSFEVVEGNPDRLLENPNSVVLTEYAAAKYFPDGGAVGKVLSVIAGSQPHELQVTGVIRDLPKKSTFQAHFIASVEVGKLFLEQIFTAMELDLDDDWYNGAMFTTYVMLSESAAEESIQESLTAISERHFTPDAEVCLELQPLEDIYFHSSHLANNPYVSGNLTAVYILILISVSILVLACVNYVILSTGQAVSRLGEIGVRKVVGATRTELVIQLLGESVLLAVLALPLAIGLMEAGLPVVNDLFRTRLNIDLLGNWQFTLGAVAITVVSGLLSGAYVAIYQSSAQPVEILGQRYLVRPGRFGLRRVLVIIQLIVFGTLVSCAAIVYRQVDFAMNRNPGYTTENLLFGSPRDDDFPRQYQLLKTEALGIPGVVSITAASWFPPNDSRAVRRVPTESDPNVTVLVEALVVDEGFTETMGLTLVGGRDFTSEMDQPDFRNAILNESAVSALGLEQAVGSTYEQVTTVVGVVKDFQFHSVRETIAPLDIKYNTDYIMEMAVRIEPGRMETVKKQLNELWVKYFPDDPDGFYSYAERVPYLYVDERRIGKIVAYAAIIAVIICCMGLFGLSLFVSRARTKEIGVRKVFGAPTSSVVGILVKEYVWLVIVSSIVSVPVTYYFMSRWLEHFVYRISMSWYIFVASGLVALIVTLGTVSIQSFRAARTNPVDSLRHE